MATELIAWISFPFGTLLAGASVAIAGYYIRMHHRNFPHIVCMALSYSVLVVLLVLTINYRIFYEGTQRFIGAIAFLIALIIGMIGLFIIFRWRAKDIKTRE